VNIEEHLLKADSRKIVLDLKVISRAVIGYDLLQQFPKSPDIPLAVSKIIYTMRLFSVSPRVVLNFRQNWAFAEITLRSWSWTSRGTRTVSTILQAKFLAARICSTARFRSVRSMKVTTTPSVVLFIIKSLWLRCDLPTTAQTKT
jgi:hypothetical protein